MKINIVGGGPDNYLPDLHTYNNIDTIWVGVDRGVLTILSRGLTPMYAFGDFDSITENDLHLLEAQIHNLHKFVPEKDETDMELALNWALNYGASEIRVFGATGGRMDHFLANVQLLVKEYIQNKTCTISIIDNKNIMFVKGPGSYNLSKINDKKYVSFLPFTEKVERLTLEGFKYSLVDRNISVGSTLCISNELIADYGTYSFLNGILVVIRSMD